jgi:hypothetical protein
MIEPMRKTALIGVEINELDWLRVLISLLRHPDPRVPELTRQALLYLTEEAAKQVFSRVNPLDHAG